MRTRGPSRYAPDAVSDPSRETASTHASPREAFRLRARLALGALATLLAINNAFPYFGLRDDSCQAMFSSLEWEDGDNNHLFLPQNMLSDLWRSWNDVHAEVASARPLDAYEQDLLRWLNQEDRELNTEATRAVIAQLCARGHRVELSYRHPDEATPRTTDDACTIPELSEPHAWIPVRLYETDGPSP